MNFTQIEKLWTDNGGPAGWAPLMAGIAMAESGGNSTVINDTPRTGDYSVGLWQINYYNGLLASRTNDFGSPAQLQADVNKQARAAISLFGGGPGITNWKNDSTYNAWIAAGAPQKPSAATVSGWLKQTGAGFGNAEPVGPGGKVTPNAVLNFSSCDGKGNIFGILGFNFTYCQLKSITGAGAIVIGGITMGLGVILMAAFGLAGSRTGRQATALVSRAPGPIGTAAKGIRGVSSGRAAPAKVTAPTKAPATKEPTVTGRHVARDDTAKRARHAPGQGGVSRNEETEMMRQANEAAQVRRSASLRERAESRRRAERSQSTKQRAG